MSEYLFTSESVSEGHPDKVADQISDAILDALLAQDPKSRVAAETLCTTGLVLLAGEITSKANIDYIGVARDTIARIGYDNTEYGIDYKGCSVQVAYDKQSPDIAQGVDRAEDDNLDQGAGDQGLMFGYATNETPEYMPLPISLAHRLARRLTEVRKKGIVPNIRPDGKTQVTFAYDENNKPVYLDTVVISTQHDPDVTQEWLEDQLRTHVLQPVIADAELEDLVTDELTLLVNPSGSFTLGGPMGDAGLTGRKIIVDTYGGMARHGGGAFSGKDPSKVDRSAAYAMRWVAKNVVAAGLADRVEVQVAYAIGRAKPVGLYVETFGTAAEGLTDEAIQAAVSEVFDLRPAAIIRDLDLLRPIYAQTAAYGHFGRTDLDLPWEHTNRVQELRAAAGL